MRRGRLRKVGPAGEAAFNVDERSSFAEGPREFFEVEL
jgi:hypothetical protein